MKKTSKKARRLQLARLVNMNSPDAVFEEVKNNFIRSYPIAAFREIRIVYNDFLALFNGYYPGYRSCNTIYHDKTHTTDTLLALSRMIDGYNLERKRKLPLKRVRISLIAMLFHDSGFIQKKSDSKGTGAKYTKEHILRSIDFIEKYFRKIGLSGSDFISARNMISCTGLTTDIKAIRFHDRAEKILGLMLGTADMVGQMAGRNYLEKLLLLYHEFKEGKVPGYESELDLLKKTIIFYGFIQVRLANDYRKMHKYIIPHLKMRYGIGEDLYQKAIENQIRYLKGILKKTPGKYRQKLKRSINNSSRESITNWK